MNGALKTFIISTATAAAIIVIFVCTFKPQCLAPSNKILIELKYQSNFFFQRAECVPCYLDLSLGIIS